MSSHIAKYFRRPETDGKEKVMPANFIDIDSLERLTSLIGESHSRPVLLFKHSRSCGISSGVIRMVQEIDAEINLVTVQTHRGISDEIARQTGIRHESPQAIVLRNGAAVYHASHYDVDVGRIGLMLAGE
jgi:bacillithiol system protein YtxJ